MGTKAYNCGCSITSSMYGDHKILNVSLCVWHIDLYDEDKTPKQLAKELSELDRKDRCYCRCHLEDYIIVDKQHKCIKCDHLHSNGETDKVNGWLPTQEIVV